MTVTSAEILAITALLVALAALVHSWRISVRVDSNDRWADEQVSDVQIQLAALKAEMHTARVAVQRIEDFLLRPKR